MESFPCAFQMVQMVQMVGRQMLIIINLVLIIFQVLPKKKKKEKKINGRIWGGTYSNKSHVTKLRLVGSLKMLRGGDFLW